MVAGMEARIQMAAFLQGRQEFGAHAAELHHRAGQQQAGDDEHRHPPAHRHLVQPVMRRCLGGEGCAGRSCGRLSQDASCGGVAYRRQALALKPAPSTVVRS
jgi:hypothetical protein